MAKLAKCTSNRRFESARCSGALAFSLSFSIYTAEIVNSLNLNCILKIHANANDELIQNFLFLFMPQEID